MKGEYPSSIESALANLSEGQMKVRLSDPDAGSILLSNHFDCRVQGKGEMQILSLFPGVELCFNRFIGSSVQFRHDPRENVLKINHCHLGRVGWEMQEGLTVYLGPGDLSLHPMYCCAHSQMRLPLGYYEGICLEVNSEAASGWIAQHAPAFHVDFSALKQTLLESKWYMVGSAGSRCEHVFRELYESAFYAERTYLQLKALELLMLLDRIPQESGADAYFPSEQTELAHHLRDHLLTNREGYVSLAQLAAEHEMSVSHLQKLFKQVYGVPVYRYIKEYRLEQAAVELVRSRKPITEIAQRAGYDNASKFSESFKKRYGKTPSRYRADKKQTAKRSIGNKTE